MLDLFLLGAGIALLLAGGTVLVRGASEVAAGFDVSPLVVGLTVVAFGTSTPELVVNIVGALRGATEIALGNVIGSNLFNSLAVLPASGVIARIPVSTAGILDLVFSLLLAAALIPVFLFGRANLGRISGVVLICVYAGYAVYRISL